MDDKTEEQEPRKSRVSIMGRRSTRSQYKSLSRMRMRSHSYGFGSVRGVRPSDRGSQLAPEFKRPQQLFLNTYQLNSFKPFDVTLVKAAVEESLDENFRDHIYNAQASPALAIRVASEILKRIKCMDFNRYRIIAVVSVGQRRAQSFVNAVSFLWDHERDNYVEVHREVPTAFVQVTVFGANEQTGHLMEINYRRPWTLATSKELHVHCRPFKRELRSLLESLQVGSEILLAIVRSGVILRVAESYAKNAQWKTATYQGYEDGIFFEWNDGEKYESELPMIETILCGAAQLVKNIDRLILNISNKAHLKNK